MERKKLARPPKRIWVPVIHGNEPTAAALAAASLAADVQLVGIVRLEKGESLSAGASKTQQLRRRARRLAAARSARVRSSTIISYKPWAELKTLAQAEAPDLLMFNWPADLKALNITAADLLSQPPCSVALVRGPLAGGPFPTAPKRVLVPMRGGPYAELSLRLGLRLRPAQVVALHLRLTGDTSPEAPYAGLEQVLARLPEVEKRSLTTPDTARAILEQAQDADLVIMGASARPPNPSTTLGPVADRVLNETPAAVIVIKTHHAFPEIPTDEAIGAQAISILVDRWFAENTFDAGEFASLKQLVALKQQQGLTISLALPALNEQATVGKVIRTVKRVLMDHTPLLDEIVLIDSQSTDRTRSIARNLDVPVHIHQELLPEMGARNGKGEALWKSLLVTRGDIIAWIDTDIVNIHPRFVYGILGPLLLNPRIQFVKGFYRRPLRVGEKIQAGGGGRVTELTARPMLNLFYPELSGVVQPLSGEYAGRRSALEQCPFFSGYGVEIGLLIEMFERYGLWGIAQVDLLERIHHNQPLEALSKMSFAIIQAIMRKLERHYERDFVADVNKSMKLIRHVSGSYFLEVEEIAERERPPMLQVPAYRQRQGSARR